MMTIVQVEIKANSNGIMNYMNDTMCRAESD